ncbi:hypothetical protein SERLA73DRAFT_150535 [Serpula lacrymans var. lacrymans S7.3]|uniref:Uncharacterized protein n=1 Tax=Serpula lacrymans var. lacrymans (strain S7.3) TaxID=936435 RepID=F8PN01_SERL3|nr:hypothetical protein SERLA73DRAFT_150535 [Serpula lacrymans var. lacrymans S7.3]
MLIHLQPAQLLLMMSKKALVEKIQKGEARWERDTMQGHNAFMMQEEERREKARKEEEAKASKAVKTAEHQAQMARLNGTEVFAGALGSKSKSDLQLIVAALSLSIDGKSERSLI